jgi:hypothetical protein
MSGWELVPDSPKYHYFAHFKSLCGKYEMNIDIPGTNLPIDDPTLCQSCQRAHVSRLARGESV